MDGPVVDFDAELNVALRVAEFARTRPDVRAVRAQDGAFGFAELGRRVEALAARLTSHGVGPETPVGVHLGRSRYLVTALLAVWRVGGVFVPLDPAHPAARLAAAARDAGVTVLVADKALPLGEPGVPVIDPAADHDPPAAGTPPAPVPLPGSLAYIVYTSGTTGEPKGVGITYGNVAGLLAAVAELAPREGLDGGNVLAPGFDGWLWSTLIPLSRGRGVVLADPRDGADDLFAEPLGIVTATPSLLAAQDVPPPGTGPATVVAAGEVCPPELAERWSSGRRFLNAYGPTETTICATWADTAAGDDPATIGRPLPNYRLHVLDPALREVADGDTGELFIAGPGVGRGYRGRPGLTATRFLPAPSGDGGRMYRTGDLVRRRPDGCLEFMGRSDQQLKIRGFRVEPAGVEAAALAVPGVVSAAAFPVPGPAGVTLGLAFMTASGEESAAETLRTHLGSVLPDHMAPTHLVPIDELPLTPAGKVDEAALVELCEAEASGPGKGTAPATPSEVLVAKVWSTALEQPVDIVEADFFELGGHSLLATRVVSALRAETGLRVTMRHLFAQRTVASVARQLDQLAEIRRASSA
ncbi:non-ribosomal peptide synthetase [Streptomyces jumonjinensis]|uniref:Amino acid adenylation domain-containing protein n=1 Tax=Streptomyces jumonjinensis TaxID=1945 RepID=A0A646KT11_STRJU|nr:non-ribosomal peptide synthetase [Streptomyces jumonjinensis]MQT04146.1 amino acid adenylation domain-containing protein [Streptomyces jumonjinensis]